MKKKLLRFISTLKSSKISKMMCIFRFEILRIRNNYALCHISILKHFWNSALLEYDMHKKKPKKCSGVHDMHRNKQIRLSKIEGKKCVKINKIQIFPVSPHKLRVTSEQAAPL